jgi:hypothetical protein
MSGAASSSAAAPSSAFWVSVLPEIGYMVSISCLPGMNVSHLRGLLTGNGIPAQSHIYLITDPKLWTALQTPDGVKNFLKTNPKPVDQSAPLKADQCFLAKPVGKFRVTRHFVPPPDPRRLSLIMTLVRRVFLFVSQVVLGWMRQHLLL